MEKETRIKLYNHSKENKKPLFFSCSEFGNFAYSDKKQVEDWEELLIANGVSHTNGDIDKRKHFIVDWRLKEGNERISK